MKAILAQITPALGDVDRNLKRHLEEIRKARRSGADLIVFPELSLTGYLLQDLVSDCAQKVGESRVLEALASASRGIGVVAGFVERGGDQILYNAAACFLKAKLTHLHRKVYLPTYGMFDEGRYFGAGEMLRSFDAPWGRTGLLICEDLWHLSNAWLLAQQRMDVLIVVSNSPTKGLDDAASPASRSSWLALARVVAQFLTCFVVYVNRTGYEDGWNYGGGSFALAPGGTLLTEGKLFKEDRPQFALNAALLRRAREASPLLRDEKIDLVRRELDRIVASRFKMEPGG